jgi:hypothetical protein
MSSHTAGERVSDDATPRPATVLPPEAIETIESERLGTIEGVRNKVLWRDAESMAGLLRVDAGFRLGDHAHRVNHHHVWVITGSADILGQRLGPNSYVHIPAGVRHDIDATDTEGCTVLYLYIRPPT